MTKSTVERRVLVTAEQKTEAAGLRAMGFTRSQAWLRVLTPEQRQVFYEQIRSGATPVCRKSTSRDHQESTKFQEQRVQARCQTQRLGVHDYGE
jgi:hypothetical protein